MCLMYAPGIRLREFDSAVRSCECVECVERDVCVLCGDMNTFDVL